MPKVFKEGDLIRWSKGTLFNAMLEGADLSLFEFAKRDLKINKEYEVLFLFKNHPTRGRGSELCSKCFFHNDCSYDIVVLKNIESYGWCAEVFDKVESEGEF